VPAYQSNSAPALPACHASLVNVRAPREGVTNDYARAGVKCNGQNAFWVGRYRYVTLHTICVLLHTSFACALCNGHGGCPISVSYYFIHYPTQSHELHIPRTFHLDFSLFSQKPIDWHERGKIR